METQTTMKSPARVAAGRRNRQLRGPLTDEGRRRLREAALATKPWKRSTGPRTAEGKAAVAENGRKHRKGEMSVREQRAALAEVNILFAEMATLRKSVALQTADD